MPPSNGTLRIGNSIVHYRAHGDGPSVVACFHGFTEDAGAFAALAAAMPGHRLVGFDLPHHGATEWREEGALAVEDWISMMEGCPELCGRRFALLGYSMGGKVALSVYERMAERTTGLFLVAPDGLRPDPWNRLATHTAAGRLLMRLTLSRPSPVRGVVDLLKSARLLDEGVHRFIRRHLDDPGLRGLVQRTWLTLRAFRPSLRKVRQQVHRQGTPTVVVFGAYDKLCPASTGLPLRRGLERHCAMHVLKAGHTLLNEKYAAQVAALLAAGVDAPQNDTA